jgi:cytidylate kinase
MIIAIDGPAGAGKSTVCRILAQKLGFLYLDTGAMYRALAWALLHEGGIPPVEEVALRLPLLPLEFSIGEKNLRILYDRKELAEELRGPQISDEASRISRLEPVRTFLLSCQRDLGRRGNVVAEGRDTATVVFPDADLKVFLTADLPTRIKRRREEYLQKGIQIPWEEMERQIRERDEADSRRTLAPLRPAVGALVVDTSDLNIDEVVELLAGEARKLGDG